MLGEQITAFKIFSPAIQFTLIVVTLRMRIVIYIQHDTYLRNFVSRANSDGTSPERSLLLKSKYSKFRKKPILVDRIPVSLLPGILNVTAKRKEGRKERSNKISNQKCEREHTHAPPAKTCIVIFTHQVYDDRKVPQGDFQLIRCRSTKFRLGACTTVGLK